MHRNIYILGGHKLATSYFTKIQEAKKQGTLDFAELFAVTEDPQALIHTQTKNVIRATNADFLLEYAWQKPAHADDALIPDHTAKHVLLQAFLKLAHTLRPKAHIELAPLQCDWQTPFLHKFENDALWATSYATWTCPADCTEPAQCPHIQAERTWDFNASLPKLFADLQTRGITCYAFACQAFYQEISQIPLTTIRQKFLDLQKQLQSNKTQQSFVIATHSHCHGILGQFCVDAGENQSIR